MIITSLFAKIILGGYWLMFAPVLLLPLGTVLLSKDARRGIVGYVVGLLSVVVAAVGVILLLTLPVPDAATVLAGLLGIWGLAAAITFVVRSSKKNRSQSQELHRKSSITC